MISACYDAICDICFEPYEATGETEHLLERAMKQDGWRIEGSLHYCPNCQEEYPEEFIE